MKTRTAKLIFTAAVALLLTACASRPLPLPEVHWRDRLRDRLIRDSIYVHDSIYVQVKGDTVWRDRLQTILDIRRETLHDTLLIRDSIPYPVEVVRTVEVDKPLGWWKKTLMYSGVFLWCAIACFIAYKIVERKTLKS